MDRKAEIGLINTEGIEVASKPAHPRGRGRLWMSLGAVLALGVACVTPQTVEPPIQLSEGGFIRPKPVVVTQAGPDIQMPVFLTPKMVGDGGLSECSRVNYLPEEDLRRDPMTFPWPIHPEIQHAVDTLNRNELIYNIDGSANLRDIQLLPADTEIDFNDPPAWYNRCLPDVVRGRPRAGIPTGGYGTVRVTLPEGLHPLYVRIYGEMFPGSGRYDNEWVFYNLWPDQPIVFTNSDYSDNVMMFGPVAFPLVLRDVEGGGVRVLAELVFPSGQGY